MTEREMFMQLWEREFQTTLKVMKAYPADRLDVKPSDKLRTARDLMWVFSGENGILQMALTGPIIFGEPPPAPNTLDELCGAFEASHNGLREMLSGMSDEDLAVTVQFPVGKGVMGNFRRQDIGWITVYDQIHHRGQLSVYLRIADGKLPSIYGPTADEPWN